MKKAYRKPLLAVESFHLDAAVATSCTGTGGIPLNHSLYGCKYEAYFAEGFCASAVIDAKGNPLDQGLEINDTNNTFCYHGALGAVMLASS